MLGFNSFLERHSLLLGHLLCAVVVFWAAWPALQMPRIEGDDYRYLHHIQQLSCDNSMGFVEAATVENRWDHLWFLDEDGSVRFFRPTVLGSYGLDWLVWGNRYEFGLNLTTVLVHLACSILVGFLLKFLERMFM